MKCLKSTNDTNKKKKKISTNTHVNKIMSHLKSPVIFNLWSGYNKRHVDNFMLTRVDRIFCFCFSFWLLEEKKNKRKRR